MKCHRCKQNIRIDSVSCATCASNFHPSCARLFLNGKPESHCCVRSLSVLLSVPPTLRLPVLPESTIAKMQSNQSFNFPVPSAHSITPNSNPLAEWEHLNTSQQLALIMQNTQSMSHDLSVLKSDVASIKSEVSLVRDQLTNVSAIVDQHSAAILHLRDQQSKNLIFCSQQPSAEIVINGIPSAIPLTHADIVKCVLHRLNLSHLSNDILDMRLFPSNSGENRAASSSAAETQQHAVFSLLVRFKSVQVRDFISEVKRKTGRLTAGDIFPDLDDASKKFIVYVNDFVTKPIYSLYKRTQAKARECGYKHTWVRQGNIYVRKDDKADVIQIFSDDDFSKML